MSTAAQVLRQAESLKASLVVDNNSRVSSESNNSSNKGGTPSETSDGNHGKDLSDRGNQEAGRAVERGGGKEGGGKGAAVDTWVTRQKLEDVYKRLLLMDLEYALDKKVEQDLWNHAFKNQITALQIQAKEKQNPKKAEVQANLNLFLETASGFYMQFLQLICSTFHLDLPFRRKSSAFGVMKEKTQLRAKITPPKRNSCLYICQYCLVHLGDIARYRQQTEQAQTYYRHAVNLSPQNGQPYNQLAILEVNRNNKLSSVFYYVRSLAVRHPFPAAATNLEKFYTKLTKDTSEFKGKMAQNEFVNAFLQFQALLHLAADLRRASYLCGRILACLPTLLLSQTFSGGLLVQCVAITIYGLNHLRHVPSGGDLSSASSPKGDGGGEGGGKMTTMMQVESLLSTEEQKSLDVILVFTASMLKLLVQHTPVVGVKARESPTLPAFQFQLSSVLELLVQHSPVVGVRARESPTLPAVQVLLDWLISAPDLIALPPFANSNIWGHLAKMLNVIQQVEEGKPSLDLTKYDDVPLPEDTELKCFQPIEKAQSKYSFSRIPVDGFPRGVEEQVRCARLVKQGKTIAEDYPELKMTAIQQNDPPRINFSGPLVMKSSESLPSTTQERRAKQNVAMQAIMKHGLGGHSDTGNNKDDPTTSTNSSSAEQSSPKYLLGTATSEPQFMKHGGGGGGGGGGGSPAIRLQASPQLSPGFARRGQSPQNRGPSASSSSSSAMPGFTSPRVASPRPGAAGPVASPLPAPQQQQASVSAAQRSPPQQEHAPAAQRTPPMLATTAHPGNTGYQPTHSSSSSSAPSSSHPGYHHQPSPPSPTARNPPLPQHPYLANLPFQGGPTTTPPVSPTALSQGHHHHPRPDQGHLPGQVHLMQGHPHGGFQGQGMSPGGKMTSVTSSTKPGHGQYPPYPLPYPGPTGERFPGPRMTPPTGPQGNTAPAPSPTPAAPPQDIPRMQQKQQKQQHYPSSGPASVPSDLPHQGGVPGSGPPRHPGPTHPLNQEMLSALRLASQISHPQSSAPGEQQQLPPRPQEQQQQQQQPPPPTPCSDIPSSACQSALMAPPLRDQEAPPPRWAPQHLFWAPDSPAPSFPAAWG
ncbi:hypothetical protein ACOMHN_027515 [Nucella lapillus]